MGADRYITDEVLTAGMVESCATLADVERILRAVLPHIAPLIRADVLRDVLRRDAEGHLYVHMDALAELRTDEAVAQ